MKKGKGPLKGAKLPAKKKQTDVVRNPQSDLESAGSQHFSSKGMEFR